MLFFTIGGCTLSKETTTYENTKSQNKSKNLVYTSNTSHNDCFLCNKSKKTLLPIYRGQKNIGIISLNTCDISPVIINRYDDYGNFIEKPTSSMSITRSNYENNDLFTMIVSNTNRGYANVNVSFKNDKTLNINKVMENFCTKCLISIMDSVWSDTPYGVGVINFETLEIRLLEENITAFSFGDYYISCNRREKQTDNDFIEYELLIFYCPERYQQP